MKKLPLDLSKFKKIKTEPHRTTLQHPDGHMLTIAHARLSPTLKGELEKIPLSEPKAFADGGEVDTPEKIAQDVAMNSPVPEKSYGRRVGEYLGNAVVDTAKDVGGAVGAVARPILDFGSGFVNGDVPPEPKVAQGLGAPPVSFQMPGDAERSLPPSNPDPYGAQASMDQQLRGLKNIGAGTQAEARALGDQGLKNASEEQKFAAQQDQNQSEYAKASAPLLEQRAHLMRDIENGHIDPKHYVDSMTTGGKISTGIGLILGGMGSGLTGQPNLAFQYLQNQIDRDIEAQRMELGKKNTLLSHNFQQTGDLREAYNLTRMQSMDVLNSHLRQIADQAADPIAKARILKVSGEMGMQTSQLAHQMALQKMVMNGVNGEGADPARMVSMFVPKEHQAKAFSEIEAAENTRKMSSSIQGAFEQAAKENTVARTGAGLLRTPASVYALHQAMQPTFKDLEGTVRQAAMDNTFKNITPAPGDSDHTVEVKRQALHDYLQSKLSAPTARAYGIDLAKFHSTAPTPERAPQSQVMTMNGKQYIRQGNYMVPVGQ